MNIHRFSFLRPVFIFRVSTGSDRLPFCTSDTSNHDHTGADHSHQTTTVRSKWLGRCVTTTDSTEQSIVSKCRNNNNKNSNAQDNASTQPGSSTTGQLLDAAGCLREKCPHRVIDILFMSGQPSEHLGGIITPRFLYHDQNRFNDAVCGRLG